MQTYVDCIPCFIRQEIDSARLATNDEQIHAKVIRKVLNLAANSDFNDRYELAGNCRREGVYAQR